MGRRICRSVYFLGGRLEIGIRCLKDIWYELLRIAVNNRKPGTLHLNHYPVTFFEYMVETVEVYGIGLDCTGRNGPGLFKSLSKSSANDVVGNHQFITCHFLILGILLRIDIDQFYYPVGICA